MRGNQTEKKNLSTAELSKSVCSSHASLETFEILGNKLDSRGSPQAGPFTILLGKLGCPQEKTSGTVHAQVRVFLCVGCEGAPDLDGRQAFVTLLQRAGMGLTKGSQAPKSHPDWIPGSGIGQP